MKNKKAQFAAFSQPGVEIGFCFLFLAGCGSRLSFFGGVFGLKGLLVVNNFISGEKFSGIYNMLLCSAEKVGIELSVMKTGEILHNLDFVRRLECDFVLFWDKDVLLAKMLESCGFRVFNSADAIFCCDNKAYTALVLQKNGVPTPQTFTAPLTYEAFGYSDKAFLKNITAETGYPVVVKELYGSFGQQVSLVENEEELFSLSESLGSKGFLLQRFVETSFGKDLRINVVGNRVICSMLRFSVNGDFRSNISNGGKMQRYEPDEAQKRIAVDACRALGLDFAGVDILFGENSEPLVCEVNSNPHFKSSLECTGIDMSLEILRYIKEKVETE